MKKFKLGLVTRLVIAIALGIVIGYYVPLPIIRGIKTFSSFFGSFLSFFIPFMIIGFVVSGIAKLASSAGILLGVTSIISYISTVIAGTFSFVVASIFYPSIVSKIEINMLEENKVIEPLFRIPLKAPIEVTAAIVLAFMLGICIAYIKNNKNKEISYKLFEEFEMIVVLVLKKLIIPILPFYIFSIFAEITFSGEVFQIISSFIKIYICIFIIHYIYMFIIYSLASVVSKKSLLFLIKNQIPAYLTAIGTQSSAATIPVNIESGEKNGTSKEIVNFVIPVCATIHLAGSMITLISCIMGILIMNNITHSASVIMPFIFMLAIAMVAAPGAPGGAVMSALPFVYMVGINTSSSLATLLIALYITQDSFGTGINVSGDNAVAIFVDEFYKKYLKKN